MIYSKKTNSLKKLKNFQGWLNQMIQESFKGRRKDVVLTLLGGSMSVLKTLLIECLEEDGLMIK